MGTLYPLSYGGIRSQRSQPTLRSAWVGTLGQIRKKPMDNRRSEA